MTSSRPRAGMDALVADADRPVLHPRRGLGHLQPDVRRPRRTGARDQGRAALGRPARAAASTLPGTGLRTYRLPAYWAPVNPCFAFRADTRPNQCPPPLAGQPPGHRREHAVGHRPPAVLRCWWAGPSGCSPTPSASTSCAWSAPCAARCSWPRRSRRSSRRCDPAWPWPACWWPVTPMTQFLAGSVNASGFEIATAIALWAHVLAVARRAERGVSRHPPQPAGRPVRVGVGHGVHPTAVGPLRRADRRAGPALGGLVHAGGPGPRPTGAADHRRPGR